MSSNEKTLRKNSTRKPSSPPKTPLTSSSTLAESFERKLNEQRALIVEQLTEVMGRSEERLMERIGELTAEMTNIKRSIAAISKRVAVVESSIGEVEMLRSEIADMRVQLNTLEGAAVSTDIILNGIPHVPAECLPDIFAKVCGAVQHKVPPLRDAFRIRSAKNQGQTNSNNGAIIFKLHSTHERNRLLKCIAVYCKGEKRSLSLSDIGMAGNGLIYMRESLPKTLREVMSFASGLKRKQLLTSAFSMRGKVFVRLKSKDEPVAVYSKAEVNALISTNNS